MVSVLKFSMLKFLKFLTGRCSGAYSSFMFAHYKTWVYIFISLYFSGFQTWTFVKISRKLVKKRLLGLTIQFLIHQIWGKSQIICISNKFPGDVSATVSRTIHFENHRSIYNNDNKKIKQVTFMSQPNLTEQPPIVGTSIKLATNTHAQAVLCYHLISV